MEDDTVEKELLWYLEQGDLTKKEKKAIKRVLAHYMAPSAYNKKFGKKAWEKMMEMED